MEKLNKQYLQNYMKDVNNLYKLAEEDIYYIDLIKYYEWILNTESIGNYYNWSYDQLVDRYYCLKQFYNHLHKIGII